MIVMESRGRCSCIILWRKPFCARRRLPNGRIAIGTNVLHCLTLAAIGKCGHVALEYLMALGMCVCPVLTNNRYDGLELAYLEFLK